MNDDQRALLVQQLVEHIIANVPDNQGLVNCPHDNCPDHPPETYEWPYSEAEAFVGWLTDRGYVK